MPGISKYARYHNRALRNIGDDATVLPDTARARFTEDVDPLGQVELVALDAGAWQLAGLQVQVELDAFLITAPCRR